MTDFSEVFFVQRQQLPGRRAVLAAEAIATFVLAENANLTRP